VSDIPPLALVRAAQAIIAETERTPHPDPWRVAHLALEACGADVANMQGDEVVARMAARLIDSETTRPHAASILTVIGQALPEKERMRRAANLRLKAMDWETAAKGMQIEDNTRICLSYRGAYQDAANLIEHGEVAW
jgi:hypothetical protein